MSPPSNGAMLGVDLIPVGVLKLSDGGGVLLGLFNGALFGCLCAQIEPIIQAMQRVCLSLLSLLIFKTI